MNATGHFLVFWLDGQRFALPVAAVGRVLRAVEVTPLPQSPELVLGIINVRGKVVPVVDLRRRCGLRLKEIDLDDQFVLAATSRRTIALPVDATEVMECALERFVPAPTILPGLSCLRGVTKDPEGLILICDLEAFLSPEEDQALEAVANGGEGAA
jgi:purine-binding chemotaxis protein CheW